jgi:hypothetical protein
MIDDDEHGRLVEFPADEVRMPPARLPQPVGKIAPGHPLLRPLTILIIILGIFVVIYLAASIIAGPPAADVGEQEPLSETYRESGAITYEGEIVHGWFLDPERQHFMTEDGRRFTYVDSHTRDGERVSGHWRLME